jgi:subtilisin family serine protease
MKKSVFNFNPKKYFVLSLLVLFVFSCQEVGFEQEKVRVENNFSVLSNDKIFGDYVPDSYIVFLQPEYLSLRLTDNYEETQNLMRAVSSDVLDKNQISRENLKRVYGKVIQGFAANLSPEEVKTLSKDPSVKKVLRDKYYYNTQRKAPPGRDKDKDPEPDPEPEPEPEPEPNPDPNPNYVRMGLDRIDQRLRPLDDSYTPVNDGDGVNVYIMDTGILTTHIDFQGRASLGYDAYLDEFKQDCNGHGTHVAGIVGGYYSGVAKEVNLISVRVLDIPHEEYPCNGAGTYEAVLGGLDWILYNAQQPAVVNMSLGGMKDAELNAAVNTVVDAGIPVIVAAGNSGDDACQWSPSSATRAYAVGAIESYTDTKALFSSTGPCVDIFAPGEWVYSAFVGSNTDFRSMSGTSMAAPHVAGVAAKILFENPQFNPQQVYDKLTETSTKHRVQHSATRNNHLLFSGLHAEGAGEINPDWNPGLIHMGIFHGRRSGNTHLIQPVWGGINYWDQVGIYRDGQLIAVTSQTNQYYYFEERANRLTSYTYKVCNERTGDCSNEVVINFN